MKPACNIYAFRNMTKQQEEVMAKKKTEAAAVSESKKSDLQEFLHEIEVKAFDIYLNRVQNNLPGNELSDWLEAEAVIKAKHGI